MERLIHLFGRPGQTASPRTTSPEDRTRLVEGLRAGAPWAAGELVHAYGALIQRVLGRVLGVGDPDRDDLLQEVFVRALQNIGSLEDPQALGGWLTSLAVFTAREQIRRRRRRRWLTFHAEPPDRDDPAAPGDDVLEAARCVYAVLARMPDDERIPLALRALEGMELTELADACGMSLSTLRRRLTRAERRFQKLARDYEALKPWIEG